MKTVLAFVASVLITCHASATMPDGGEFTRLRLDYASSPNAMFSFAVDDGRRALLEIYKTDKKKFVEGATAWLEKCPVDTKVRIMLASALIDLGRFAETIPHRYIYYGLLQSIVGKSDGFSKETGFRVISIDEEYSVCSYLGAQVLEQRIDGHFDVLTVTLNGEKKKLYFDASIVFKNENKAFGTKK